MRRGRTRRIGVVIGEFPLLSHTFVISQVDGLRQRGFDVSVICDRIGSDSRIDAGAEPMRSLLAETTRWWKAPPLARICVSRLPAGLQDKVSTAADLFWNQELNRCDLLLAHFGNNGLRLARAKKRDRLAPPFVTIFHGRDVGVPAHSGRLDSYKPLFQYGAQLLTVNEVFRRTLIEAGAPAQRTSVQRMGIDCGSIPYHPRSLGSGPLQLISVGRLVEKKGTAVALHALAALAAAKPEIDWRYTVVGDGPLRPALQALSDELGLADRVRFHGALPHSEVMGLLDQAHVFLLPSVAAADGDVEGIPVALMEAMAAGLLVVSTFHSGIPELVDNGRTGLLAPEKDAGALAAQLARAAQSPDAIPVMTQAARRQVETQYNNRILLDQLAELITALLAAADVARATGRHSAPLQSSCGRDTLQVDDRG